jgi:hypothetical protein
VASLEILLQIIIAHLRERPGMKWFHLRWVTHYLIDPQKANRIRCAKK